MTQHVRPEWSAKRAWQSLLVASAAVAAVACGTLWHGPGSRPLGTAGAVVDVTMLDASHGWVRTAHALLRTDDGGVNWQATPLSAGLDLGRISVAAYAGTASAWLCEQGASQGSSSMTPNPEGDPRNLMTPLARCFATGDTGRTWTSGTVSGTASSFTARTRLDASVISLTAIDGRHAWAVVRRVSIFAGGGRESIDLHDMSLLHTDDGGATWAVVRRRAPAEDGTPNTLTGLPWVRYAAARTGWLGGFLPGRIEVTHDGGTTWQSVPAPVPVPATAAEILALQRVALVSDGGIVEPVVVGGVATSYRVVVLVSRDGGRSWTASPPLDVGRTVAQVDVLDDKHWWIATGATLRATTDSGAHWTAISASAPAPELDSVQMLSPQVGLAVGVDPAHTRDADRADTAAWRQLLRTGDGGRTWRPAALTATAPTPRS
jgi:photosystem II stability/assembly factor-like uncharacterized protein